MTKAVKYHVGKFPPKKLDLERLLPLIGDAREAVGRYDGLLFAIPNSDVMLSPLTTQEAVLSSRIEGTQVTMGDVLGYEAGAIDGELDERKLGDIHEVINYRKAMRQAAELLNEIPLCQRLIKELHGTLLSGVRGHDKHRGKYRPIQNWIGTSEDISEAKFIPIAPGEPLQSAMDAWEKCRTTEHFGGKKAVLTLTSDRCRYPSRRPRPAPRRAAPRGRGPRAPLGARTGS